MKIRRNCNKLFALVFVFILAACLIQPAGAEAATNVLKVTNNRYVMVAGRTYKVTNSGAYGFTVSNSKVARITSKGKITPLKTGYVTITAKVAGKKISAAFLCVDANGTVSTQSKLNKLLAASNVKKITLKNLTKSGTYTIAGGNYTSKRLNVVAPLSDVTVNGNFKSIDIADTTAGLNSTSQAEPGTITGKAYLNGNIGNLTVNSSKMLVIIAGTVNAAVISSDSVNVAEKGAATFTGSSSGTVTAEAGSTVHVASGITVKAEGAASIDVTAAAVKAGANVIIEEGAEPTIRVAADAASSLPVTLANGNSTSVQPGQTYQNSGSNGSTGTVTAVTTATPSLSVNSSLYGSVFTYGKSTLKYMLNSDIAYTASSKAVLSLALSDGTAVDDAKIDSSNAKVELTTGDGYYPSEYSFKATALSGKWSNGSYVYTLSKGDLELNTALYTLTDKNSGREWSCLGGDGHGNYHFNLKVSGIQYNGITVAAQIIPLHIYVFGYNYTSDANSLYGTAGTQPITPVQQTLRKNTGRSAAQDTTPVWTWVGYGEEPVLCDQKEDDFYITWPSTQNASSLTSDKVKITLKSEYGDQRVLTPGSDYYVYSSEKETQLALTFINWAFIPVYDTMTIEVSLNSQSYTKTYSIASVYVYEAQQGGGGTTVDGTVTAFSFYGLANLTSWNQLMSKAIYVLSYANSGTTYYYAEDAQGTASVTTDITAARQFDASGSSDRNQQLIGNTLYVTNRSDVQTVEKTVSGNTVTFTKTYPGRGSAISSGGGLLSPSACDQTLKALPGYVIPWDTTNWITNEKWAWQASVAEGWTGITVSPYVGKFEYTIAKGSTQQFTASLNGVSDPVTWAIAGKVSEGTSVDQNGLVTVAAGETNTSFAVYVTDAAGNLGSVFIKVQ